MLPAQVAVMGPWALGFMYNAPVLPPGPAPFMTSGLLIVPLAVRFTCSCVLVVTVVKLGLPPETRVPTEVVPEPAVVAAVISSTLMPAIVPPKATAKVSLPALLAVLVTVTGIPVNPRPLKRLFNCVWMAPASAVVPLYVIAAVVGFVVPFG